MIKVIERHKPYVEPKIIKYRITCENCESVFECAPSDLHYEIVGHGCGGDAIDCPVCGNHIQEMYRIGAKKWEVIRE